MQLKLSVPNYSGRLITDVEVRPSAVEAWLQELPLLNVADTSRSVFSSLSVKNRIALDTALRLRLLELYRYTVDQLSLELQKHYLGLPLPLSERHRAMAEQNRQFQLEMAIGYKRVVLDGLEGPAPNAQHAALPIQRAIHYLTEALAISYESYAPAPLAVWQQIHALYRHAEMLGATDVPVEDACNQALQQSSVGHAYRKALLLDLSDPYHLPARFVDKIHHYLDRWAPLAQLGPARRRRDPVCLFLVDLESDQGSTVYTGDISLEQPERYRLLGTVELARKVHAQLSELQRAPGVAANGLDPGFLSEDAQGLLLRLMSSWGLHPTRQFRRSTRLDARLDVAIGINVINYWVNGGSRFQVSSSFVGPMPKRTLVGPSEMKEQVIRDPELEYATWDVLDESAGGLALAKKGLVRFRVRVGDLIATRAANSDAPWIIAAIRWVRSANPSSVEIGTERLAPSADAVVIKTLNEKNEESDFLPALRLPEIQSLKQKASLITHCNVYRQGRMLYMDDGFRLYRIVPENLLEQTSAFERFTFRILEA